ncbi:hypothetical protein GCM10009529_22270 [Micropruina glycogenica]
MRSATVSVGAPALFWQVPASFLLVGANSFRVPVAFTAGPDEAVLVGEVDVAAVGDVLADSDGVVVGDSPTIGVSDALAPGDGATTPPGWVRAQPVTASAAPAVTAMVRSQSRAVTQSMLNDARADTAQRLARAGRSVPVETPASVACEVAGLRPM